MNASLPVVLLGGGLANGLLAFRLVERRPELQLLLVERGATIGGNHTWSFHESDLTPPQLEWVRPLISRSWEGHDVACGPARRHLRGRYCSIRSTDFHERVIERLGPTRARSSCEVSRVTPTEVELSTGERLAATAVIDGRGFRATPPWPCGFQKFVGLDVRFERPHGLVRPLLMDTQVPQEGGLRFIYLLPWDERRMLVEDTVYADDARLDLARFRARIADYLAQRGFGAFTVEREEAAALPLPLSGAPASSELPTVGVAGGFFHATTGYSLPFAVALADRLAEAPFEPGSLRSLLEREARAHWRRQGFFRLLNRLLFFAAAPSERERIFASFYQHDEALIGRFYAGALTARDIFTVLRRGAPTVPFWSAARAALEV